MHLLRGFKWIRWVRCLGRLISVMRSCWGCSLIFMRSVVPWLRAILPPRIRYIMPRRPCCSPPTRYSRWRHASSNQSNRWTRLSTCSQAACPQNFNSTNHATRNSSKTSSTTSKIWTTKQTTSADNYIKHRLNWNSCWWLSSPHLWSWV